jgi:predicted PolB exonuclease-like 3'-5' exonuclease
VSHVLYLDIETIRDPSNPGKDRDDGSLPAAPHHLIVAACAVALVSKNGPARWYEATQAVIFGHERASLLLHVAEAFERLPSLVTWNGSGFDLPVLRASMMAEGIPCQWLFNSSVMNRYRDDHRELMDILCQRGAGPRWSLDGTAKRMGLPGKLDTNGAQVAELYAAGKLDEIQAYCLQDCFQLSAIDLRLQLASGELTLDGYRRSAASLLRLGAETPALRPVVESERFQRQRFLGEAM